MPKYIVKPDRNEDFYVNWSEIVDSPTAWGTKSEVEKILGYEPGSADDRFQRADETGTSSYDRRFGGWSDSGFIFEQIGWLSRRHLKAICLWLEEHDDIEGFPHLEPLEG